MELPAIDGEAELNRRGSAILGDDLPFACLRRGLARAL